MIIPDHLINILDEMLYELYENRLEVQLAPNKKSELSKEGRYIRAVVSKNIDWYRDFCYMYSNSRKRRNNAFDTRIRRQNTISYLKTMIKKRKSCSKYAQDIIDIAEKRYQDYKYYEEQEKADLIPWNNQF